MTIFSTNLKRMLSEITNPIIPQQFKKGLHKSLQQLFGNLLDSEASFLQHTDMVLSDNEIVLGRTITANTITNNKCAISFTLQFKHK